MKDYINKIRYNIVRSYLLYSFTNHLGKVVEEPNKITCYVKQNRCKKESYYYTIACFGINPQKKELAKQYNLNKPICYIIDGLVFESDKVHLWGYHNCEVIIKNCKFGFDISLHIDGKCTLENTYIKAFSQLFISANDLIIKNMDIRNHLFYSTVLKIILGSDEEIEIDNSTIGKINGRNNVTIIAPQKIYINNSQIAGEHVECETHTLIANPNSIIEAEKELTLKVNNLPEITVNAPQIKYNGESINGDGKLVIKPITNPKHLKALELIQLLKKINQECEEQNKQQLEEYTEMLKKEQICKVLKKDKTNNI